MSIPLVRNNTKDAINTSIIAIKKNLERINSILGLVNSSEPDLGGLATKQELEDAVTEINNTIDEVETSLQPVDTVTSGDMHSVTSNAVASEIIDIKTPVYLNTYTTTGSNLTLSNNIDIYKCLYFKVLINDVVVNTNLCLTTDKNTIFTIKYITDNNTQATVSFSFNKTKISITVFNTVTQLIVYGIK